MKDGPNEKLAWLFTFIGILGAMAASAAHERGGDQAFGVLVCVTSWVAAVWFSNRPDR
jgi:drug/metabolite transporter (DMT)-like permease